MGVSVKNEKVEILFRSIFRSAAPGGEETMSWEDSRCQRMEYTVSGEHFQKGDTHYCLYEEQPEGWEEPYKAMLKWKSAVLEQHKKGKAASRIVFEPGKCRRDFYRTPFGELLLDIQTHRLDICEEKEKFLLLLEYDIRQEDRIISENRMEIQIKRLL
ncbi:MAG: DUF1934 domain-containing protein [Acetatifactor sp.]|nr:DUF1934 domain-containing protein [Acetatifactor sp.]